MLYYTIAYYTILYYIILYYIMGLEDHGPVRPGVAGRAVHRRLRHELLRVSLGLSYYSIACLVYYATLPYLTLQYSIV